MDRDSMAEVVPIINHPQLSERVYEVLKDRILSAQLPPGRQLHVAELADRLGVSRTPVKDALKRLSAEGFVEEVPRKGYFVSRLDAQDIVDLLDARLMLELVAAERGIGLIDTVQIDEMRRIVGAMEQLLDGEGNYVDYAEFINRDCQFHLLIMSFANNRRLVEIYRALYLHLQAVRMRLAVDVGYHRPMETLRGHKAIVNAFESRNLLALKAALTRHAEVAKQRYAGIKLG